ncbi:hypothetical protein DEA98_10135 [Brucella pseudogrignonensis]|nr:hypothetical protein [Brucella pseudogrignonensis]
MLQGPPFQNGNAHLWFTRKDLVKKVNEILADHYGEVLGDGLTKEEDPLKNVKTTPARYFGFYPTPDAAADTVLSHVRLLQRKDEPQIRILEPSAGPTLSRHTGRLRQLVRRA